MLNLNIIQLFCGHSPHQFHMYDLLGIPVNPLLAPVDGDDNITHRVIVY